MVSAFGCQVAFSCRGCETKDAPCDCASWGLVCQRSCHLFPAYDTLQIEAKQWFGTLRCPICLHRQQHRGIAFHALLAQIDIANLTKSDAARCFMPRLSLAGGSGLSVFRSSSLHFCLEVRVAVSRETAFCAAGDAPTTTKAETHEAVRV